MSTSSRHRLRISRTWFDWRIDTVARDVEATVWLGLGTNLGDRRKNLAAALQAIHPVGRIEALSSVYESEPVGISDQPDFWNLVVRVKSRLTARQLLSELRRIEVALGREPGPRWGPRLIDIDILMYGDEIVSEPGLRVPHPRMLERGFVMRPLSEIDPQASHPESGLNIGVLVATRTFEANRRLFPGHELLDIE